MNGNSGPVQEITADQLREWINQDTPLLLLDVRQPDEYSGPLGRIPGAELMPLAMLGKHIGQIKTRARGKKTVIICNSGNRSIQSAALLAQAGLIDVYSLAGGMKSWNG